MQNIKETIAKRDAVWDYIWHSQESNEEKLKFLAKAKCILEILGHNNSFDIEQPDPEREYLFDQ